MTTVLRITKSDFVHDSLAPFWMPKDSWKLGALWQTTDHEITIMSMTILSNRICCNSITVATIIRYNSGLQYYIILNPLFRVWFNQNIVS
jgi:hypothetical protein